VTIYLRPLPVPLRATFLAPVLLAVAGFVLWAPGPGAHAQTAQPPATGTSGTTAARRAGAQPGKAAQAAKPTAPATQAGSATSPMPPASPAPDSPAARAAAAKRRAAAAKEAAEDKPRPAGAAGATGPGRPAAPPAGSTVGGAPPPDLGRIDQILEGDEDVLSGGGFTYDPGNRRDPFKSLLVAPDKPEFRGPRPEGVPGLLIDEIDLKGIYRTARGYVAQVTAANQKKSYLLKEGDQLYDGDVVSIGRNEVVFKQIVQDPTALKPFREVTKSLTPQ
jgi:hypothetical protein